LRGLFIKQELFFLFLIEKFFIINLAEKEMKNIILFEEMREDIHCRRKMLDDLFLNWLHNPLFSPYD